MVFKSPGFTAIAILTLALGIGANTAIFSVMNAVLLRPLPFRDPGRLVWVADFVPRQNSILVLDSDYFAWRRQNEVFEDMAAYTGRDLTLTGVGDPERLQAGKITASFLTVLGVKPLLGRGILAQEDRPGGPRVVLLSHALWQRRFGAEASVIGEILALDGNNYTVVGVMPAGFEFVGNIKPDLFVPLALPDKADLAGRTVTLLNVIARLKPAVTLQRAESDLTTINHRLQSMYPVPFAQMMAGAQARVVPLHDKLVGNVRPSLLVLLGAVGFVLLIACANIANLQLARAVTRQKEIAIRSALGADRLRLARQFLTESVLLAALGGAAGVWLAPWGVGFLRAFGPEDIPRLASVRIDSVVLLFTGMISLSTGILFGLVAVLAASKVSPNNSLKEGGTRTTSSQGRHRLRGILVVCELALAFVLLIGSGLLIRSFLRLTRIDPGFNARNVLTLWLSLPLNKYREANQQRAFFQELIEKVQALPGVSSVGVTSALPTMGSVMSAGVEIEGRPVAPPGQGLSALVDTVSPAYFHTMGIPLVAGRFFDHRDASGAPKVLIVNQSFAHRFFPNESPIGKRLQVGDQGWISVVGVVGDVRQLGPATQPSPQMFVPYLQSPSVSMALVIRTASDALDLMTAARSQVKVIDKDLPVYDAATMEQRLSETVGSEWFNMFVIGIFAGLALMLAAAGTYGVTAYSVAQRTHEIGVRVALGAQSGDVLRLVVGQGLVLTLIGVGIGLGAAFPLTRVLSSLLYGVTATDPATFVAVSLLLTGVALLASYIPARRATKVDPMVALRYE
jgi:putative ABC transport system permease protein